MSYGIQRPDEFTDVNSIIYRQWFQRVYDYITSRVRTVTVTTSYSVVSSIFYVRADATAGPITITLPAAIMFAGRQIVVKKIDASANAVTISRVGTDTIEGSATMSLAAQWNKQTLISNGNNAWEKL